MKYYLIGCICFFAQFTQAQEERVIVVRETKTARPPKERKDRNVENYNAIKFDPLRMTTGEIGFSWERRIEDKTSLEFELGPTISGIGMNRFYFNSETQSKFGVLLSAAVRYYPIEGAWAMNKLYVSPKIRYRRFNSLAQSSTYNLSDEKGFSNEWAFSFNVGYQTWLSDNFAFDFYAGLGIGSFAGRNAFINSVYDGNTGQYVYNWQIENYSYAKLMGVVGMKVTVGN
jgi:hypothetical protein